MSDQRINRLQSDITRAQGASQGITEFDDPKKNPMKGRKAERAHPGESAKRGESSKFKVFKEKVKARWKALISRKGKQAPKDQQTKPEKSTTEAFERSQPYRKPPELKPISSQPDQPQEVVSSKAESPPPNPIENSPEHQQMIDELLTPIDPVEKKKPSFFEKILNFFKDLFGSSKKEKSTPQKARNFQATPIEDGNHPLSPTYKKKETKAREKPITPGAPTDEITTDRRPTAETTATEKKFKGEVTYKVRDGKELSPGEIKSILKREPFVTVLDLSGQKLSFQAFASICEHGNHLKELKAQKALTDLVSISQFRDLVKYGPDLLPNIQSNLRGIKKLDLSGNLLCKGWFGGKVEKGIIDTLPLFSGLEEIDLRGNNVRNPQKLVDAFEREHGRKILIQS